jgi:hypothetical protein
MAIEMKGNKERAPSQRCECAHKKRGKGKGRTQYHVDHCCSSVVYFYSLHALYLAKN